MKEAIGNSMLLYIVITIVIIVMLLFAGILSYAKAYRVKNKIINIVEKYGYYDEAVADEISNSLQTSGYIMKNNDTGCGENKTSFRYCIYKKETNDGYYYKVITFTHMDIPIIGDFIDIPVSSETKILGKNYDY